MVGMGQKDINVNNEVQRKRCFLNPEYRIKHTALSHTRMIWEKNWQQHILYIINSVEKHLKYDVLTSSHNSPIKHDNMTQTIII